MAHNLDFEFDPRLNADANTRWRIAAQEAGLSSIGTTYAPDLDCVIIQLSKVKGQYYQRTFSRELYEACNEDIAIAGFFEDTPGAP